MKKTLVLVALVLGVAGCSSMGGTGATSSYAGGTTHGGWSADADARSPTGAGVNPAGG